MATNAADIRRFNDRKIRQKTIQTLSGLLKGIAIDGQVNDKEVDELKGWLEKYRRDLRKWRLEAVANQIDIWLADGKIDNDELADVQWLADHLSQWNDSEDLLQVVIQELHGIFHGLLADRELTDAEIRGLQEWVANNEFLKGVYPYDEIESLVVTILADGKVTEDERNLMRSFMADFIDFSASKNLSIDRYHELKKKYTVSGICATDPQIDFDGKVFCMTGEFEHGKRSDMERLVVARAGLVSRNMTKKVDYLVVGSQGNECWAFVGYGRKVEQAIENRKNGCPVVIVSEADFWDAIQ